MFFLLSSPSDRHLHRCVDAFPPPGAPLAPLHPLRGVTTTRKKSSFSKPQNLHISKICCTFALKIQNISHGVIYTPLKQANTPYHHVPFNYRLGTMFSAPI